MMKGLLWRGMLAGLLAALIAATFARAVAEPSIDRAIAVEARHEGHATHGDADEEIVSRATQKGLGLYTAMILYGAAMGGLLAIVFAASYGRATMIGPRSLSLLLGLAAFLVLVLVPALKYPPNPPAVGQPDTIEARTADYFTMLAASIAASWGAAARFRRLARRVSTIDRLAIAAAVFGIVVALVQAMLPAVDEVPADFPASLLWRFRVESIGTQALFWIAVAYLFGAMAERLFESHSR